MGISWFLISVLILAGYVMLFWLVKKRLVSLWGASILAGFSLIAYIAFPAMVGKMEIQTLTLMLILLVLTGFFIYTTVERKIQEQGKLCIDFDFARWMENCRNINLTKIINTGKLRDLLENIGSGAGSFIKGLNLKEKLRNIGIPKFKIKGKSTSIEAESLNNKQESSRGEYYDAEVSGVPDTGQDDEIFSYVDFDKKGDNYEDIFSKYIRGEITLDDVSKNIKNRTEKPNIIWREKELTASIEETSTAQMICENGMKNEPNEGEIRDTNQEVNHDMTESSEKSEIEQFIEKAFEMKEKGMFLEAVDYYIKALDKKPEDDLILWIVIDICSLYKQMGQNKLAREMMQSYIDTFGGTLSPQTKEELIKSM